ncbi:MAG: hypothetical protein WCE94_06600 [Candidatus Methanoperedens sp.]
MVLDMAAISALVSEVFASMTALGFIYLPKFFALILPAIMGWLGVGQQ